MDLTMRSKSGVVRCLDCLKDGGWFSVSCLLSVQGESGRLLDVGIAVWVVLSLSAVGGGVART